MGDPSYDLIMFSCWRRKLWFPREMSQSAHRREIYGKVSRGFDTTCEVGRNLVPSAMYIPILDSSVQNTTHLCVTCCVEKYSHTGAEDKGGPAK